MISEPSLNQKMSGIGQATTWHSKRLVPPTPTSSNPVREMVDDDMMMAYYRGDLRLLL